MISAFKGSMLPALAKGDEAAKECCRKAHIQIPGAGLPIRFKLSQLFDAVWLWAKHEGVKLPERTEYNKDLLGFVEQLANPWPVEEAAKVGLVILPKKTVGAVVDREYELANT